VGLSVLFNSETDSPSITNLSGISIIMVDQTSLNAMEPLYGLITMETLYSDQWNLSVEPLYNGLSGTSLQWTKWNLSTMDSVEPLYSGPSRISLLWTQQNLSTMDTAEPLYCGPSGTSGPRGTSLQWTQQNLSTVDSPSSHETEYRTTKLSHHVTHYIRTSWTPL
jgi:hypothetical protein